MVLATLRRLDAEISTAVQRELSGAALNVTVGIVHNALNRLAEPVHRDRVIGAFADILAERERWAKNEAQ